MACNTISYGSENVGKRSGTKKGPGSKSAPHRLQEHPSADTVQFTPELVENCAENRNMDYRFLCPHAGQFQCNFTNLVFGMKGKGEVQYSIVPWDRHVLDGLGQTDPAGPLYSIDCPEGSVRRLRLPHCETRKDKVKLTVAHVTGDKVEMMQPHTVTNTHVTINIQSLSRFGLISRRTGFLIRAQVLLFYRKVTEHNIIELNIHLLPANVPVREVQKEHLSYKYIQTASNCDLTPGKKYSLCCKTTDGDYKPSPEVVRFYYDCGPNYHPTFVLHLNSEADKVTLSLLDKNGKKVWTPPETLLTDTDMSDTEAATPGMETAGADFVDRHREKLIQRFPSVMEVADCLKSKNMITDEMYSNIQAEPTAQDKMRALYTCLDSAGRAAKDEFYNILKQRHRCLVDDLNSG